MTNVLGAPGAELPDHRRLARYRLQINYAAPDPDARRRDEKWPRRDWMIPEMTLPVRGPVTLMDEQEFVAILAKSVWAEMWRRPLRTSDRFGMERA